MPHLTCCLIRRTASQENTPRPGLLQNLVTRKKPSTTPRTICFIGVARTQEENAKSGKPINPKSATRVVSKTKINKVHGLRALIIIGTNVSTTTEQL
jgi:hypothetical protein